MKKEIKMNRAAWASAEKALYKQIYEPKPKGSITAIQYAEMTQRSLSHASRLLRSLYRAGLAKRKNWHNGKSGTEHVYWLK